MSKSHSYILLYNFRTKDYYLELLRILSLYYRKPNYKLALIINDEIT